MIWWFVTCSFFVLLSCFNIAVNLAVGAMSTKSLLPLTIMLAKAHEIEPELKDYYRLLGQVKQAVTYWAVVFVAFFSMGVYMLWGGFVC